MSQFLNVVTSKKQALDLYSQFLNVVLDADEYIHDKNEFGEENDKGNVILHNLINVSLLQSSEKRKCVQMNKVLWPLKYHHKLEISIFGKAM